jgi:hypothetical protein
VTIFAVIGMGIGIGIGVGIDIGMGYKSDLLIVEGSINAD